MWMAVIFMTTHPDCIFLKDNHLGFCPWFINSLLLRVKHIDAQLIIKEFLATFSNCAMKVHYGPAAGESKGRPMLPSARPREVPHPQPFPLSVLRWPTLDQEESTIKHQRQWGAPVCSEPQPTPQAGQEFPQCSSRPTAARRVFTIQMGKPLMPPRPHQPVPLPILGPVSKATLIHVFAVAEAQPDHK